MNFTPRTTAVEAAAVELAGQRLYAVAVDGKAHLIDATAFELLFDLGEAMATATVSMKAAMGKPKARATKKPKRVFEVAQRCIDILTTHGPLTSAELRDHVYSGEKDPRKRMQNFSALSLDLRKRAIIERRTDPRTQLDKWHLVGGE